jgi:hypothetical protein
VCLRKERIVAAKFPALSCWHRQLLAHDNHAAIAAFALFYVQPPAFRKGGDPRKASQQQSAVRLNGARSLIRVIPAAPAQ